MQRARPPLTAPSLLCFTVRKETNRRGTNPAPSFGDSSQLDSNRLFCLYPCRAFQGETRWDNPAEFQEASSQALVEVGYNDATGAVADQSVLAEYYGKPVWCARAMVLALSTQVRLCSLVLGAVPNQGQDSACNCVLLRGCRQDQVMASG